MSTINQLFERYNENIFNWNKFIIGCINNKNIHDDVAKDNIKWIVSKNAFLKSLNTMILSIDVKKSQDSIAYIEEVYTIQDIKSMIDVAPNMNLLFLLSMMIERSIDKAHIVVTDRKIRDIIIVEPLIHKYAILKNEYSRKNTFLFCNYIYKILKYSTDECLREIALKHVLRWITISKVPVTYKNIQKLPVLNTTILLSYLMQDECQIIEKDILNIARQYIGEEPIVSDDDFVVIIGDTVRQLYELACDETADIQLRQNILHSLQYVKLSELHASRCENNEEKEWFNSDIFKMGLNKLYRELVILDPLYHFLFESEVKYFEMKYINKVYISLSEIPLFFIHGNVIMDDRAIIVSNSVSNIEHIFSIS